MSVKKNKQAWNCLDSLNYLYYWNKSVKKPRLKTLLGETLRLTGCHAMRLVTSMPLVSPCYLQDAMPCQWPSSELQVLQMWESVFYSQVFFYLKLLPAGFKASLGAGSSTSRLAGLHADLWNIALAWLFVWITTIHKIVMLLGFI